MNIGEAARASGVSAKMIRHYEAIGLIAPQGRTEAGYRLYGAQEVEVLRFIRRSRDLGFSLDQTGTLLSLWRDRGRASADVRDVARTHLAELEVKAREIEQMSATLSALIDACHGDGSPDCSILNGLSGARAKS